MAVSLLSCVGVSLVDVFYCSTNTTVLSTRVDKGSVARITLDVGARRVDARHSVVVAGVVLTRWCESAIVGVVNVTRGLFALSCSVEFFACRLIWQDSGL